MKVTNLLSSAFLCLLLVPIVVAPRPVWAATNDFRVYLNDSCIVADEPVVAPDADSSKEGGWAGFILSNPGQAIVTGIIRSIASAIGKAAAKQDIVQSAERELYLYVADFSESPGARLAQELGCLTIVSGKFADEPADCESEYEPAIHEGPVESLEQVIASTAGRPVANVLKRANICLVDEPDLFFESRVEISEDGTALRLRGAGIEINALSSARKPTDRRALLQTVTLLEPSEDGRGRQLASTWINYGRVVAGTAVDKTAADKVVSGWTPVPELSSGARQTYQADSAQYAKIGKEISKLERRIVRQVRQIGELRSQRDGVDRETAALIDTEIQRLNVAILVDNAKVEAWRGEFAGLPGGEKRYMPVTLRVTITESKSQQQLQAWLAEFLDVNSVDLAQHLTEAIIQGL